MDSNLSGLIDCKLGSLEEFEKKYGPKKDIFIEVNERGKGGFGTVYEHDSGVAIKQASTAD